MEPLGLQYEAGFRAIQPHINGVPYHYQGRLTSHLHKLNADGVIEDVDSSEPMDVILNVSISEKTTARGT